MRRIDNMIWSVVLVGSFFSGVVWAPAFSGHSLKDTLEVTSYLATIIACFIAGTTLVAWRSQFRHAERYATLKTLKAAITDLHSYRGFLLAVKKSCDYQIANAGEVDPELRDKELKKRQQMLSAIGDYNKAWAAAVGFLSPDEEARFIGTPARFAQLSIERPSQLFRACLSCLSEGSEADYNAMMEEFNAEAMHIYALTVGEVERLLRDKV